MTVEGDPARHPRSAECRPEPAPGEAWPPWAWAFFALLRARGTVRAAAKAIGKHRSSVYEWFEKAPSFERECRRAQRLSYAVYERAVELAVDGTRTPLVYHGQIVAMKQTVYPALLKALLREGRPRRRKKNGTPVTPTDLELVEATGELLSRMAATVPPEQPLPSTAARPTESEAA